jgi:hypothetical protein
MLLKRKSNELSLLTTRLLEDESWQIGEDEERRIKLSFALAWLKHAHHEGKDLEVMYARIIKMLRADVEEKNGKVSAV